MGGHLTSVGIPDEPAALESAIAAVMPRATTLGQRADGVRVMAYEDPSGSRLAVTVDARNNITCFTPSFRGSPRRVQTLGFSPHECEFEQPLNIELRDLTGGTEMPLAVQLEDAALVPQVLSMDAAITLRVAGLVEGCEWWQNDDAYNATGKQLAVESFIPSGTFPADQQWADFVVTPTAIVTGRVISIDRLMNQAFGLPFAHAVVQSFETTYDLLFGPEDVPEQTEVGWLCREAHGSRAD